MHSPNDEQYWVAVPGDSFTMGITEKERDAWIMANTQLGLTPERVSDELPGHEVTVNSFSIAKYPVTNRVFSEFVSGGGYGNLRLFLELTKDYGAQMRKQLDSYVDKSGNPGPATWVDGTYPDEKADHPVDGISFYEAIACARFFEARLPTEAEWEFAARRPDGRQFPWGNDIPEKDIANFKWNKVGGTSAVGSFAPGTSGLGLVDLAGNVHEWTNSLYEAYPEGKVRYRFNAEENSRVARGGAYNGDLWDLRCTSRFGVNARLRFPGLGLRLVR